MADESLNDSGETYPGAYQDILLSAATDYIAANGIPSDRDALSWLANPNYETVIDTWMAKAGGFSTDNWLSMITSVNSVDIYPHGKGIDIYIHFDFEDESGDYAGDRTANARM